LSESLEQQTATSEVLKGISSSPGDLEPVFTAILTNATRLCAAKFGNLWLCKNGGFQLAAVHGIPPAYGERLQVGNVYHAGPKLPIARATTPGEQFTSSIFARIWPIWTGNRSPELLSNWVRFAHSLRYHA